MIIFIALLLALCIYKCKFNVKSFNADNYCSIDETRSITGICQLLILISHTFALCTSSNILDDIYAPFRTFVGQFVVVPFLFFSGYGIMESIKKKDSYVKTFPKRRLLPFVIKFLIITIIYIPINLIMRPELQLTHYLLSFTGLKTIGNGGWYIFATIMIYLFIILSFNVFKNKHFWAVSTVFALVAILTVIELVLDFPEYYYSTMIFFPIGMYFSMYKVYFDKIVTKNNIIWSLCTIISIAGFALLKLLVKKTFVFFPVWCFFGMLMILCITIKLKINNKILAWVGKNSLYIFLLQSIPHILLIKLQEINNFLFYITVFVSTIALAFLANYIEKLIKGRKKAI